MRTGSICPAGFITKEQIDPYLGTMEENGTEQKGSSAQASL